MVARRLRWNVETRRIINLTQCGSCSNRITVDCAAHLQNENLNAFHKKEEVVAVFFNLQKAYDMARKHRIQQKTRSHNENGNIFNLTCSVLNNQSFRVKNGYSDT